MSAAYYGTVIFVKDISASRRFYEDLLGQEIEHDFGANIIFKSHISLWQIAANHEIARLTSQENSNRFELYFETEDINSITLKITESSTSLLHQLKTEPWGQKTIRFFDPDDHLIEIGESLPTFVSRIHSETGSVEKVCEITGVDRKTVENIIA